MSNIQQKLQRQMSPGSIPPMTSEIRNINMSGSGLGSPPSETSIPMTNALLKQNSNARASLGDNASVSSLNMSQLASLPGSKMLQYIRSDQFGQHGES